MKPDHQNNNNEAKLHEIFDRLMRKFDLDPDADLIPQKIGETEPFLSLYGIQGLQSWLHFYDLDIFELNRFIFSGSEAAFGLSPLSEAPNSEEVTELLNGVSKVVDDPELFQPELIDDNINLKAVQLILANRCLLASHVCVFRFKVPIQVIINNARSGDREAFLRLVKLDSTFLYTDYGRAFVLEAELKNSFEFKKQLANSLKPNPKFWSLKGKRKVYALFTLWSLDDYAYRSDKEWAEFLVQHDFTDWADPGNVKKARLNNNLPKLSR